MLVESVKRTREGLKIGHCKLQIEEEFRVPTIFNLQ